MLWNILSVPTAYEGYWATKSEVIRFLVTQAPWNQEEIGGPQNKAKICLGISEVPIKY